MTLLLEGKVAAVTGAGRGVARGVAIELAKAGVDIAVVDIDADNAHKVAGEITELSRRSIAIACDVSRRDQVDAAVARTVSELGGLNILVNMAHYLAPGFDKPLIEITDKDFENQLGARADGYLLLHAGGLSAPQGWREDHQHRLGGGNPGVRADGRVRRLERGYPRP